MTQFGTKRIASRKVAFDLCGPVGDQYFEQSAGRIHENRLWLAVLSAMRGEAKTIVDVGANVGFTAAMAARRVPGARIIAIEPSATAYECLCRTIATNEFVNVTAIHAFMSSEDKLVHFREKTGNLAASGLAGLSGGGERVVCRSIDSLAQELNLPPIDLMKIDVGGHELSVLDGLGQSEPAPIIVADFSPLGIMGATRRLPMDFLGKIRARFGEFYYVGNSRRSLHVRDADDLSEVLALNIQQDGGIGDMVFSADRQRFTRIIGHKAIRSLPGPRGPRTGVARTPRNLFRFFTGTLR
jgi:FkbM family methyltransferase